MWYTIPSSDVTIFGLSTGDRSGKVGTSPETLGNALNRFLMSESLYEEKRSGMVAGLVPEPCRSQDVAVCRASSHDVMVDSQGTQKVLGILQPD